MGKKPKCYYHKLCCCCSVTQLAQLLATPWTTAHQASLSSPSPRACSNSCPLRCHPIISSSVIPFSSRLLSSPASGSFPTSQRFYSGCQSIGVSASASVLPMYSGCFPFGLTVLAVQGTLKSLLQQFESISSSAFSLPYGPTHIHT